LPLELGDWSFVMATSVLDRGQWGEPLRAETKSLATLGDDVTHQIEPPVRSSSSPNHKSTSCRTQADAEDDQSVTATLRLPGGVQAGQYTLGVALVDQNSEKPAIRLAIEAPQTDRLYHVSSIGVK
jgi:hypothetical protein